MEGWIISLAIAVFGIAVSWGVQKSDIAKSKKTDDDQDKKIEELQKFMNAKEPLLAHLSKVEESCGKKLDFHNADITKLKQEITQVPTMKEVREEFVSKEMFKQMEKHIDEKFDRVEVGLSKILEKLEK